MTAKYIFEHVKPGTVKFVLIGLAPYSLRYENNESLQYMLALNTPPQNVHNKLLLELVSDNVKNSVANINAEQADLNFDNEKSNFTKDLTTKAIVNWEEELNNLTKKLFPDSVKKNLQILKDYIKLCISNGAKPVGVVFPFSPIMKKNYDEESLTLFRLAVRQLEEIYDFTFIDLFDLNLGYDCFYNLTHLNLHGSILASTFLGLQLYRKKILPAEYFCGMNYEYFNTLSNILPKNIYNNLMSRVFKITTEKLSRKEKIKVAFISDNAAMWCGDKLYNYFSQNERFETTVFLCPNMPEINNPTVIKDFKHGVKQFKSRGINVVGLDNIDAQIEKQDIIFFLRPYLEYFPNSFRLLRLTSETLLVNIPYTFSISGLDIYNLPLFQVLWKHFFDTPNILADYEKNCKVAVHGYYSGYPRLDGFFDKNSNLKYDWKMTYPDAIKIIYAPHWSISGGVKYSTFQWNYKFFYELAKANPQISWIVKPHPHLLHSAVESGLFPSVEKFEEYMQDWDNLPNAKVETGAYYHEIFATSDGMILDSASFIGEYQYTHKPMIFLTRDTQKFNDLTKELMKVTYRVDGRDLDGIAALIEKIFIDKIDELYNERLKFFDKHYNYVKANGMTASEFIFKNISEELGIKHGD